MPAAAAGFVALKSFGAMLIVDTAGVAVGECFVGFGDFNEFLMRGGIVSGLVLVWKGTLARR